MGFVKTVAEILLCLFAVVGFCTIGFEVLKLFARRRIRSRLQLVVRFDRTVSIENQLHDIFDAGLATDLIDNIYLVSDGLSDEDIRICRIFCHGDKGMQLVSSDELERKFR